MINVSAAGFDLILRTEAKNVQYSAPVHIVQAQRTSNPHVTT